MLLSYQLLLLLVTLYLTLDMGVVFHITLISSIEANKNAP